MADRMQIMQDYLEKVVAGDWDAVEPFYTDDVGFHWAGKEPLSGDYQSKEEWRTAISKMQGAVDSATIEKHDVLISDDHAVVLDVGTYNRGGESFTTNRVVVYHFDGDLISDVWITDYDQAGTDEFLS